MKILLVNNPSAELESLQHVLTNNQWQIYRANNISEALTLLKQHRFNIIISLAILEKHAGLELLKAIQKKFPQAVRVLINNSNDNDIIFKASEIVHASFNFPIDVEHIKASLL